MAMAAVCNVSGEVCARVREREKNGTEEACCGLRRRGLACGSTGALDGERRSGAVACCGVRR